MKGALHMKWIWHARGYTLMFEGKKRAKVYHRFSSGVEVFIYDDHETPTQCETFPESNVPPDSRTRAQRWAELQIIDQIPVEDLPLYIEKLTEEHQRHFIAEKLQNGC
jgi:hypothetical protein